MKIMRSLFIPVVVLLFLVSCSCDHDRQSDNFDPDIAENKLPRVKVDIRRYEQALFSLNTDSLADGLKSIQGDYELFLAADLDDPQNVKQLRDYLTDPIIISNYKECVSRYPDLQDLSRQLSVSFSYYKYYYPDWEPPKVYTYVSGGDFAAPIKNADSAIIIALDLYLGKSFPFYARYGVPAYKAHWMEGAYIARDCMEELAIVRCNQENSEPTFLDQMISMGKVYYFLDLTMPGTPDSVKIKYKPEWMEWCQRNEGQVWAFFIDNKLLYSKKHESFLKFFADGPFTTTFGNQSPPRIALWTGWQIVRAYVRENPEMKIQDIIKEKDSQKILQESKYKPKKES